jgi:uncharacterized protein (DUF1810 family)
LIDDRFDLQRFVAAQERDYERALAEIKCGAKTSHWMWYIFPQVAGLGRSPIAQHYAIRSLDEARAYLAHPILGERLRACVAALDRLAGTTATAIFGSIDAAKLRSSLTLFAEAGAEGWAEAALARWFRSKDEMTLAILGRMAAGKG